MMVGGLTHQQSGLFGLQMKHTMKHLGKSVGNMENLKESFEFAKVIYSI